MGSDWKSSVTRVHSYDKDQKIDNSTLGTVTTSFKQEEKDISLELTDSSSYLVELAAKEDLTPLIEKCL